jgi:hypothetical protein
MTSVEQVLPQDDPQFNADLRQVLGYLNFSSGKSELKTLQALNRLYAHALPGSPYEGLPAYLQIHQWLGDALDELQDTDPAFAEAEQAVKVLELTWIQLLPAYTDFHRDLLFHQEPEGLFNGFFLGRAVEAVLQQGGPWGETERILAGAINELNDYVGVRPVAVLEGRRLEPYPHEWVRPIPLFIAGAGVTRGPYEQVIAAALEILAATDAGLLQRAHFDLGLLDELALDPRAYDFDHPVNRRPNYHFGQWDPHLIDGAGFYRRFVVQQVTLDALLARVEEERHLPREELIQEAAAVLAGTMLMASGVSGSSPSTYSSTTTLGSLLAPIAQYRDEFYEQFLERLRGPHLKRLLEEQQIRRQPLGGARQHLNTYLARQRASQLEHVQLSRLFARMGNAVAAKEQADFVPVPSARLIAHLDCLLTSGNRALQLGLLDEAAETLPQIMDWVHRAVQCGAIVDPWNILGFAGNFPRFHGPDAAVHDHRVPELVTLMEQIFALQSRIWREAAGTGRQDLCQLTERDFRINMEWWRQFAAHEVGDVEATDPLDTFQSAQLVAKALQLWHEGGSATGDVRFWAPHAELFDSPKAYALVVESLLDRQDFIASMALLVHWLSQAGRVGLQSGNASFSDLARKWLQRLEHSLTQPPAATTANSTSESTASATSAASTSEPPASLPQPTAPRPMADWSVAQKFFDYLEANAEHFWQPPTFRLATARRKRPGQGSSDPDLNLLFSGGDSLDAEDDADGAQDLYGAAYDDVVYQDSTDDGVESETAEEGSDTADELVLESNRLGQHLTFLNALAQMWKTAALSPHLRSQLKLDNERAEQTRVAMEHWATQAAANRIGLLELIAQVSAYNIAHGGADLDSMARYDRQRLLKESLLERIIATAIETSDARRMLLAVLHGSQRASTSLLNQITSLPEDDRLSVETFAYLLHGDAQGAATHFPRLIAALRTKRLLYIPLARGGDPAQIYSVRLRRRVLSHLLAWLPRQGLFLEACKLIEAARFMEHHNPVGPGAITEFDDLFKLGYRAMVRAVVRNAYAWRIHELQLRQASTSTSTGTGSGKGASKGASKGKGRGKGTAKGKGRQGQETLAEPAGSGTGADVDQPQGAQPQEAAPAGPAKRVRKRKTELASESAAATSDPAATSAAPELQIPDLDRHDGESLGDREPDGEELIGVLQLLTEVLLGSWLAHSRTLRLSVLETIDSERHWKQLVDFIQRYGAPLFTQNFLKLGNVRAILHQGVGPWLEKVREEGNNEEVAPLLEAIDTRTIQLALAEHLLGVVLEAIIDHHSEYRDYNSTTTQSDRGEMLYMLLDFLRLRVRYDRVCWNLRPIFWTHEVLVRAGCHQTAQQWRRALAERIGSEADMYLEQLAILQKKYAMRMPTVADRLQERFTRPMTIDRMKALVGPAIRQFREVGQESQSFTLLIDECKLMMEQPTGVGLDIPQWLNALEEEVDRVLESERGFSQHPEYDAAVEYRQLSSELIMDQLNSAAKTGKTMNLPGM